MEGFNKSATKPKPLRYGKQKPINIYIKSVTYWTRPIVRKDHNVEIQHEDILDVLLSSLVGASVSEMHSTLRLLLLFDASNLETIGQHY